MADAPPPVVEVSLTGDYDIARADEIRHELLNRTLGLRSPRVVADLSAITFLDASGLSVLLTARAVLESEGGQLRLLGPSSPVRRLLELTGTCAVFDVEVPTDQVTDGSCSATRT